MRNVALIIDGVWQHPQVNDDHCAVNARNDSHVISSSMSEVDQIVALLGQVVRRAQSLSDTDQRRVRDFVHAASSMLSATTYLPKADQKVFETALRDVASRNR
ncbi:hypothetical protein [Bradyrhizobium sp. AUGA SZCCT0283]|uniref:hypothetical protein n=1 Tax=Bradyrhizobium sp. AUGA SZCCT0283 TaxID=2807671 RepID=UPI001BAD5690|nr:hypothetical protein [Bradyrhizobium sp. AUGA SZCCT0283]MBR1276106.1 hypothetical protein [Bradyrhizobium sp. AUGA SZCCT0283]